MASRPASLWTGLFSLDFAFRLIVIALMTVNVVWHGLVALFIGGPFGLGLFLFGVVTLLVGSRVVVRRMRAASAEERPDAVPAVEAREPDPPAVVTGVG